MYSVDFKDDMLKIEVNLAGYAKDDVELAIVDNTLKLKYGNNNDEQYLGRLLTRANRFTGKKFTTEKPEAKMQHGLLTLIFRPEEKEKRLIAIS